MAEGSDAVGIVGLGLMGGLLARALRARNPRQLLIGVEPDPKTRARARKERLFEKVFPRPTAELSRCEVVVLCAPVAAILRLLAPVSRRMRDGAILTDIGGVKGPILAAARTRVRPGVAFVGAHPMFGGEKAGYAASLPHAWKGGTVAVCSDGASDRAVARIARLHRALGARVVLCTAAEHDAAAAAVSQVPHLVASALALAARDAGPLARRLAGKGFADTTRLAAFAYPVQGEAARRNPRLPWAARSFLRHLRDLLRALSAPPPAARSALSRARAARIAFEREAFGPRVTGRNAR